MTCLYWVAIRRNFDTAVRENAEQLEGRAFLFERGWVIEDQKHYRGETAMLPRDENYPVSGPTWIASGDLVAVEG